MTIAELQPTEPKRDRWGRYIITPRDGGKARGYTRATTIAETLDDRYNLELWKMRQVAVGLSRRSDLLALVAADESDKKAVNAACKEAMDAAESGAAANTGTALHRILERVDTGELTVDSVPEMFTDVVGRYRSALDAAGVTVVTDYCERVHVVEGLAEPIAGMADNHIVIGGRRYIADKKTGSGIDFGAGGFAVQLAIYAHATSIYDYGSDTHSDMPAVDQERAVIIHVPAAGGEVTLHWLDIAAGWEALDHALWVRAWRKRKGDLLSNYDAPTAKTSPPTRIEPVGIATEPKVAPEGAMVDPERISELRRRAKSDVKVSATLARWALDAERARTGWTIGKGERSTERRYGLSSAALAMAEHIAADDDAEVADAVARAALHLVIDTEADKPMLSVGALIGTLDLDQARRLWKIATTASLTFEADGTPRLSVAA